MKKLNIIFIALFSLLQTIPCFSQLETGFPLPFLEPWNSGTFETNNWLTDAANWSINGNEGNPSPCAEFTWDPIQSDYSISLESYQLLADSKTEGKIYLDFDIKLDDFSGDGLEHMNLQVWNWDNQLWTTVNTYSNEDGDFDWASEHLNITGLAMGEVFKVRFTAQGENSVHIVSWFIDNIHVYRVCEAPGELTAECDFNLQAIVLNWTGPGSGNSDEWIHWDDRVNAGNSIGGPLEFDVAARWEPSQLAIYEGASVTEIAFFPYEAQCTYNVRVWTGANAANMVVDQPVPTPVIGEWNYVILATPVPVDITKELWVGYYVNAQAGYPAGVDDGPAIDGYGNMMNCGGWQTLLEINPDLDYNWNIAAFIQHDSMLSDTLQYAIYRSDDGSPYFFLDYSNQNYFFDESACDPFGVFREYKISALYIHGNDTCESGFSNEAADICEGINDKINESYISIYPNPCNDLLKIESSEELELISIYNSFGELMLMNKVDGKLNEINVKDFPTGVYLMRVFLGQEFVNRKIIIEH